MIIKEIKIRDSYSKMFKLTIYTYRANIRHINCDENSSSGQMKIINPMFIGALVETVRYRREILFIIRMNPTNREEIVLFISFLHKQRKRRSRITYA